MKLKIGKPDSESVYLAEIEGDIVLFVNHSAVAYFNSDEKAFTVFEGTLSDCDIKTRVCGA